MRVTILAIGLVLTATACETGVDGDGRIAVPRSVLALFEAGKPGQVILRAEIPNVSTVVTRAGILCGDAGADRTFPVKLFSFGCAAAGQVKVSAWATSVMLKSPGCSETSPAPDLFTPDAPPPSPLAFAEQETPMKVDSGLARCHDGSYSFNLTLAPLGM